MIRAFAGVSRPRVVQVPIIWAVSAERHCTFVNAPLIFRFLGCSVDNNWIENQIRPIAIGRNNWLFAGSLRAGQRAAAVMSLIQSARMNGHDPYVYLKDVLTRLVLAGTVASAIALLGCPRNWV
jgi:hypothetical protein